jgi:hypothetical protein
MVAKVQSVLPVAVAVITDVIACSDVQGYG